MPCADLSGTEYIDDVVAVHFGGSYAKALEHFVMDPVNLWCPKWIKRNYEIQNRPDRDTTAPAYLTTDDDSDNSEPSTGPDAPDKLAVRKSGLPHARSKKYKIEYVFEPAGEPNDDSNNEECAARQDSSTTLTHWAKANLTAEHQHSGYGPNMNAEATKTQRQQEQFEILVNPINPSIPYDAYWDDHEQRCKMSTWERLETEQPKYSDDTLSRETLNDDHQQLFVTLILDHVQHLLECIRQGVQPSPMRLLLLGSAGAGKSRAVRTLSLIHI